MTRFIQGIFILGIVLFAACTPKSAKYFAAAEAQYKQAEYQHAIENYQQAMSEGYDASQCNYYIAECYRRSNRIQQAEPYYKKALEGGIKDEEASFFYANALKSVGNYEGAATQYKDYIKNGSNFDYINRAKTELTNLKALQAIVDQKSYYEIENVGPLNTPDAEYAPFFFHDKLYFTSNRGVTEMYAQTGTGFTNLFEYVFDGSDKFSGQATELSNIINTEDAHEASCILTKDGKTMIFARGNTGSKKKTARKDVDLYSSALQSDGTWSEPLLLKINDSLGWDACPALSPDEKTLFFASNREGGVGNVDIYKATRNAEGEWDNATNVGAPINTKGNELYPYLYKDGTFYFSSDGHPSFGKLDVFYIKNKAGKMAIENIGKPVNSSFDDFGLIWKDSLDGYFVSDRPDNGAKGDDDIYFVKNNYWNRNAHYVIDGTALGCSKESPEYILPGTNVYLLSEKGDTVSKTVADSAGKFTFNVEPDKNYFLVGDKDKYFAQVRENWVPFSVKSVPFDSLAVGDNEIKRAAKVKLVKKQEIVIVRNILYDYDKWNIRPDAAKELDVIVELMKNNPELKIELGSHTDERGAADYNRKLAEKRAQSAVEYIVNHGIAQDRIVAKGYGEDEPKVKGAKTEDEHQTNRRTTFKVLNHYGDETEIKTEN